MIVLFGPTNAGKTYIGKLLQKHFGYYFYDGDSDLTPEMTRALNIMKPITDSMRDRFFERLLTSIDKLATRQTKLVVAQTFIKEKYRREVLKRWPEAQLVLIKTKPSVRQHRWQKRADYPWNEAYVKRMDALFETPKIPHLVLTNDSSNSTHLLASLRQLLSALS